MVGTDILHYRIRRRLGEGAMGVVFEAFDTWLERPVALKFLHESKRLSLTALRMFAREAKIAAQLDHPNIGTVYALERSQDDVFLAMALYAGQSLDQVLLQGRLPAPSAHQIALELARGLEYAHSKGVVHRDIKPSNVFLAEQPNGTQIAKILDFGLSKLGERSTVQSLHVVGTPAYMAPEQLEGKASSKSDLWAWGVVVYEMLCGVSPFWHENMVAIFQNILLEEPIPLGTRTPDAPENLIALVEQCLCKNPEERPLDASELVRGLQQSSLRGLQSSSLIALPSVKHHLPIPTTAFIGRETELLELHRQMQQDPFGTRICPARSSNLFRRGAFY
jgi:eukaryotic-like serine/threonine-protein kinase